MRKQFTLICSLILSAALSTTMFAAGPQRTMKISSRSGGDALTAVATDKVEHPLSVKTVKNARRAFTTTRVDLKKAVRESNFTYIDRAMRRAAAAVPELTGCITYANSWTEDYSPVGLYTIPTSDLGEFELKVKDVECVSGVEVNGSYYWIMAYDFGFFQMALGGVYDLATGQSLWSSSFDEYEDSAVDMAFDKTASWPLVYGLTNNGKRLSYYQFNGNDNTITAYKVADLDQTYTSLAIDGSGQFYVIDLESRLYKMDKNTGATTLIGYTGYDSYYLGGCIIDEASGKMYRTISNNAPEVSGLVEIDLSTGAGTLISTFTDEEAVSGLYVSGAGVTDDPNAVTPPYTNTFDNEESLEGYTVINANNDENEWFWTSATFLGEANGFMRMAYNSDMAMDDWLISVPLRLKGGETYEVSIQAWTNSFGERVGLYYGSEPTAEGMANLIVSQNVSEANAQLTPATVKGSVTPERSGIYYIGIHACSDADSYYLSVDNLTVTAPLSSRVPAQVSNLTAVAAAGGAKSVTVSFEAPTTDAGGDELSAITGIEVFRNDSETAVKTFESVAPGQSFTFIDTPAASGVYTYSVYASNSYGRGAVASAEVFCGIGLPEAIAEVNIAEGEPGVVTLSWTPVTHDKNGLELSASDVTYSIYGPDDYGYFSDLIQGGLTTTEFTFRAVVEGDQDFVQYGVCAVTESGAGMGTFSGMIPAGSPYENISESFANGTIANGNIWGVNSSDDTEWNLFMDADLDVPAQDGDNGYIGMVGRYLEDWGELLSGKVDLSKIANPGLTFYTYNISDKDTNIIGVSVRKINGEWVSLMEKPINEIRADEGWGKITLSLADYANEVVQIKITGTVTSYAYILFDRIKIGSLLAADLEAADIAAPATVKTGSEYKVTVTVSNEGTAAAEGWSVELYADGELAATEAGSALASGEKTAVVFTRAMHALANEAVSYSAKVVFAADANTANNETSSVIVTPSVSKLPTVGDLDGSFAAEGVALAWTAPSLENVPADPVTESFEDGEAFAHSFEGWTFVDGDNSPVGGFNGTNVPGINTGETTASFFVFDSSGSAFNDYFKAYTGDKYLAALFRYDDGTTDDWAISPALSGSAQTIEFYAKSYSPTYLEKIEIYYSTGSVNPDDFVKVVSATTVPSSWTLFSADLPDGAKYFAIRSCATGSFMLMLDDVTYTPAGGLEGVEIKGYNVYRNGECINAEPVAETSFVDADAPEGTNTYVVTVVYNREESRASNPVSVEVSGLSKLTSGMKIYAVKGAVVIEGAEGQTATVAAASGRAMFDGVCGTRTEVRVSTGVYVVKVGEKSVKVMVR